MEMMGENDNSNFFSEEIIIDGDIEKTLMNYITDPNDEVRQKFPAILVNLLEQQPLEETLAHIHVYISAIFVVSEDKMPAVRFNLVQQIFYIFLFCQKNYYYKLSFYLYDRLLQIILKYFHDEDPSVRREAYSTLQRILLEKCIKDEKIIEEQICPIISQQLKQRNCPTEDEAQLLMASLVTMFRTAPLLSSEKAEKFFLDNFIDLCSFKIDHIRRACARMYPIMCHVLGKEITENRLIEPFRQLCGDNCWVVRKSCAESIPLIALTVSRQCRIDKLTPLVLQLANDVSKSVFSSTFKILGEFMSTFAQPCIIGLAYTYTGDLRIINPMDSDFAELSDSELFHNYEHYSKMFSKTSLSSYLPIRNHQEQSSSQSQLSESESNLDKSFLVNGSIDDNENENDDVDDDDDDNNNNSVDNKTITEAVTETSSSATTVPLTIRNTTTSNSFTNNTTTTTTADDQKNSNNDNKNNTKILTPKEIAQIIIDNREKLIKEINNESYVKRTLWTNTGAMQQFGGSSLDIFSNQTIETTETTTTNPPPPISLTSTITTTAIELQAEASSTGISTMNYFGSNINDGGNNNLTGETDADVNSSLSVSSSSSTASASSPTSLASASATSSTSTPNFKSRKFDFSSHLVDLSLIIRRAIDENKKRNEEIKVFGSGSWGINKNNNSNSPNCGKKLRRQLRELKTAAISEDEPIWSTTSSSNSRSRIDNNFSCNKINSNCNSFNNNNNDNSNDKFDNKAKEQNKSDNDENIRIENLNVEQEDKKDTVADIIDEFTNSPKQIEIVSQMSEMDNLINEYVKMEKESKKIINDDNNGDKQQDRYDNDNMDASTNENAAAAAATNAYYVDKNENENENEKEKEKEKEDRESNWADQEEDWDDDVEIVYNEFVSEANKIKKFNEEKNTINDDDNANVNVNTDSSKADQNNDVRADTTTIINDYTDDADDDVFKNFNSYKYWYIEPSQLSNIDDIDDELLLMKSDTEQKQQKSGIIRCNSFVSSSLSSYLSSTSNTTSTTTSSSSFLLSSTLPSRSIASITTIEGQTAAIGGPMTTMLMTAIPPNNNLTTIHNRTFNDLKKLSINFEQNIMPSCLLKTYVEMVLSYKDEEISYNSARSFPAVALTIGKQNWHIIKPVMQYLCDDLHWKVRSTMASSIDVLATILGKEIATEDLVPIYIGFFKDIDEVKIEAIRIFSYFLKAVDIPKHDEILSNVGTCLKVDSTMNWHIKEDLAKQIFLLIKMYEPIQKHNNLLYLTSLTALFLEDKISCVREIAADALVSMIQIFDENHREAIVKIFIVEEFALSDNWRKRQTFLNIIYKLITCKPPLVHLVCMVLDNVEKLSYDSVPNIRIFVAKIVIQLKTLDCSESNILKLNSDNDKIVSEIFERLCKDKDRGVREICDSILSTFDNNYEWNYELLE